MILIDLNIYLLISKIKLYVGKTIIYAAIWLKEFVINLSALSLDLYNFDYELSLCI